MFKSTNLLFILVSLELLGNKFFIHTIIIIIIITIFIQPLKNVCDNKYKQNMNFVNLIMMI